MKIDIVNHKMQKSDEFSLPKFFDEITPRHDLIQDIIRWQLSKKRIGSHKTKQRAEISGSTKKIFRQKGRGAARHGSKKAPIFIGGGITFGPIIREHGFKINKKVRKIALLSALKMSMDNKVFDIIDTSAVNIKEPNIKSCKEVVDSYKSNKSLFVISNNEQERLMSKSISNIKNFDFLSVDGINVRDIVMHEKVVFTLNAIKMFFENNRGM